MLETTAGDSRTPSRYMVGVQYPVALRNRTVSPRKVEELSPTVWTATPGSPRKRSPVRSADDCSMS